MKAFEVFVNGKRFCTAGIGDLGVLNAIVGWHGKLPDELTFNLHVGGLDTTTNEHLRWAAPPIGLGDEILIRLVESSQIDPPNKRYKTA